MTWDDRRKGDIYLEGFMDFFFSPARGLYPGVVRCALTHLYTQRRIPCQC